MWTAGTRLLHHNNKTPHTALSIRQFLAKHSIPILPSPDFSHPDTFLFPKLKITLKGRRFQTVEDIINNATDVLKAIQQTYFEQCFQKWRKRWQTCIAAQGDYFEGDNIQ
jgi:hypothetical protein